jgi:hypothetical protein
VKIHRLSWPLLVALLYACAPLRPQVPQPEIPAGPLVHAIEQRREAFQSLKAVAKVTVERRGRVRVYESVAVVQRGQDRLRIEGIGPLGQALFVLLWDGSDLFLLDAGEGEPRRMGPAALAGLLGVDLSPAELCAALSGNATAQPPDAAARAGCRADGRCIVEFRTGDARQLVTLAHPLPGPGSGAVIESVERYQGSGLVYRSTFASAGRIGGDRLPQRVVIESPERRIAVTVQYEDAEVNAPLDDEAFTLSGGDGR